MMIKIKEYYTDENGFSLMEVLVAMLIATIAIIVILSTVQLGWKTWKSSGRELELYSKCGIALQTIAGDIRSTIMPPIIWPTNPKGAEARRYYGFWGNEENMTFFAYSPDAAFIGGLMRKRSAICQIEYKLEDTAGAVKRLLRYITHDDFSDPCYQLKTEELLTGIYELKFRYYDGKGIDWFKQWDSRNDPVIRQRIPLESRIPKAVEISVMLDDKELPEGANKPRLVTTVYLPASRF